MFSYFTCAGVACLLYGADLANALTIFWTLRFLPLRRIESSWTEENGEEKDQNLKKEDKDEIASELADILIFCFHFATLYDFDISTIFQAKLAKAQIKYPVIVFNKDSDAGYDEFKRIKQDYRKGKL